MGSLKPTLLTKPAAPNIVFVMILEHCPWRSAKVAVISNPTGKRNAETTRRVDVSFLKQNYSLEYGKHILPDIALATAKIVAMAYPF